MKKAYKMLLFALVISLTMGFNNQIFGKTESDCRSEAARKVNADVEEDGYMDSTVYTSRYEKYYNACLDSIIEQPKYDETLVPKDLSSKVKNIWYTAIVLVQILSVACVVFAGVRYMYASADKKADLKRGLMYLAIGAIFVFCAVTVAQFIINATTKIVEV